MKIALTALAASMLLAGAATAQQAPSAPPPPPPPPVDHQTPHHPAPPPVDPAVPAPPAPQPRVPGWATLAVGAFVLSFGAAALARRSPRQALLVGVVSGAVVIVIRPSTPALLALGSRAPAALEPVEAARTFEALQANVYRAFDYEAESAVYDALARSVAAPASPCRCWIMRWCARRSE